MAEEEQTKVERIHPEIPEKSKHVTGYWISENLIDRPLYTVFCRQRSGAKTRRIELELTFQQWLCIWVSSGKLGSRGKGRGQYMMCRTKEPGPYSVDNVYIGTAKQNQADLRKRIPSMERYLVRISR